jgi:hypothetical protein
MGVYTIIYEIQSYIYIKYYYLCLYIYERANELSWVYTNYVHEH